MRHAHAGIAVPPARSIATGTRSFSKAPASARSLASDGRIGCPLAANSAQSLVARLHVRRAGRPPLQLFASNFPADRRPRPRQDAQGRIFGHDRSIGGVRHSKCLGLRAFGMTNPPKSRMFRRADCQSFTEMFIFRTSLSGSGRSRSIARSPLRELAPCDRMPSASTKHRWNCRAAMPR